MPTANVPSTEVKPYRRAVSFGVGAYSRVEEEKDRCMLKAKLCPSQQL